MLGTFKAEHSTAYPGRYRVDCVSGHTTLTVLDDVSSIQKATAIVDAFNAVLHAVTAP